MHLKKLTLNSVIEVLSNGGSTCPLLVLAEDEKGDLDQYVVKFYDENYCKYDYVVAKEIIVSNLANYFDLPTPEIGVIDIPAEIYFEHTKSETKLAKNLRFSNKYYQSAILYNPQKKKSFLQNYDYENVFAFDNLLLNADRGGFRNKPNLLIQKDNFLLIDHEQSLTFYNTQNIRQDVDFKSKFLIYPYYNHVFFDRVKNENINFDEFHQHLKLFNLNIFDSIFAKLDYFNIQNGGKDLCISYFKWAKENCEFVVNTLKDRLSR